MSEPKCPKCGAEFLTYYNYGICEMFKCRTRTDRETGAIEDESEQCLRNQLAQRESREAKLLDELEYQRQMAAKAELRVLELEGQLKDAGAALLRIQKSRAKKYAQEAAQAESE